MAEWKDKRKVMRRYDLTADIYEERYGEEQRAKYGAALESFKMGGGEVLDVGCGTGLFFNHVAACARVVVGIDISRKLLLKANKETKKKGNLFVLQADADYLPFKKGSFEAVFAFTVLQNMPQPSKTLQEFKRVAKQNGNIVVTGLKKIFRLDKFMELLEGTSLRVASFVDIENLKCYVAVLEAN